MQKLIHSGLVSSVNAGKGHHDVQLEQLHGKKVKLQVSINMPSWE